MKDNSNFNKEIKDRGQRDVENNKLKRQAKTVLKRYECDEEYEDEQMYSSFEKFHTKNR